MTDLTTPTVLFVDDETNILSALKRLVRKQPYRSIFANSGAEALDKMSQYNIDLIVSDMKMPQMNGAQLLAQVVQSYPDTYRIILSGYADLPSTIDAVNEGKIHRFLQKPWQNELLLEAIVEGLEFAKLKVANEQMRRQIEAQNNKLKQLNGTLEKKVILRTKQIHHALKKMQGQNRALEKVLYNTININPHLNGEFAKRVSNLSRRLGVNSNLKDQDLRDVSLAGLLSEIGLMSLDTSIFSRPLDELSHPQRDEFYAQVESAKLILAPADYMANVAMILEQQFLPYSGIAGQDKPIYTDIAFGARILNIARDYWSYRLQKIVNREFSHEQTIVQLNKFKGTKYDPELLNLLQEIEEDLFDSPEIDGIKTNELKPGMILKENLYTPSHILILTEGHEFTIRSIEKLMQFEKSKQISLRVQTT